MVDRSSNDSLRPVLVKSSQMGPGKWVSENLKFDTFLHIIATSESLVIDTLVQHTFSGRPFSAIYFFVKNVKIGPYLYIWCLVEISKNHFLVLKMPT